MTTFVNNDVASGNVIYAADHNTQGALLAGVLNGNVDSTNLADGSVTTTKIADGSVTNAKLDTVTLGWQTWSPTIVGFSANPTNSVYRYRRIGNTIDLAITQGVNGTSNSTLFTISLPVQAATITNMTWTSRPSLTVNAGVASASTTLGLGFISSGATVLECFRDFNGLSWTNSGGKRITHVYITYECVP